MQSKNKRPYTSCSSLWWGILSASLVYVLETTRPTTARLLGSPKEVKLFSTSLVQPREGPRFIQGGWKERPLFRLQHLPDRSRCVCVGSGACNPLTSPPDTVRHWITKPKDTRDYLACTRNPSATATSLQKMRYCCLSKPEGNRDSIRIYQNQTFFNINVRLSRTPRTLHQSMSYSM